MPILSRATKEISKVRHRRHPLNPMREFSVASLQQAIAMRSELENKLFHLNLQIKKMTDNRPKETV